MCENKITRFDYQYLKNANLVGYSPRSPLWFLCLLSAELCLLFWIPCSSLPKSHRWSSHTELLVVSRMWSSPTSKADMFIPTPQVKKVRFRVVGWSAHAHTCAQWQTGEGDLLDPGLHTAHLIHRRQANPDFANPLWQASLGPEMTAQGSKLGDCWPLACCCAQDKHSILLQAFDSCFAVEYDTQSPNMEKQEIMTISISNRTKCLLLLFQRQISLRAWQGNLREHYKWCLWNYCCGFGFFSCCFQKPSIFCGWIKSCFSLGNCWY